ncbi:hypothetical protein SAMN03097694_2338 [Janthinobacterium lividum]|uniref:Uncharacterized protein n=2 Tax=Janthinobacterium lividum TaxID=29581 RepID=A0AB38C7C0_9BURK|nr:hypothetical protein SAMN03097694_2338 [Janthinobacterium lividum]
MIRDFLLRHNINYSYDKFSNRYQGIIRGAMNERGVDCAVVVYINVTNEGKYLSSEFVESYTGI